MNKDRQRALSFWSIGSWGGSGFSSIFGGVIATFIGWQWIFIFSIIVSLISIILIKGIPESRNIRPTKDRFDNLGLVLLVVILLSLNIIITQTAQLLSLIHI